MVFLKGNESLTIAPFWHQGQEVFPKGCYHYELKESFNQMVKLKLIDLKCIHDTDKNIIFTKRKFLTIYERSTLRKKTEFCKNVKFDVYGSYFNVSLSWLQLDSNPEPLSS